MNNDKAIIEFGFSRIWRILQFYWIQPLAMVDNTPLDRSAEFFISHLQLASFINNISKYNRNLTETNIKDSKADQVGQEVILAFGKSFSDHCHSD